MQVGTAAFGLYSRCGVWVSRNLTDGFVPAEVAALYGTREWIERLVATGLWSPVDGGFAMPDYLVRHRNKPAEKVRAEREMKAKRQSRWLEARRNGSPEHKSVSRRANRPSKDASIDAQKDDAHPLPSHREGVGTAPRREAPPPPPEQPAPAPRTSPPLCGPHQQPQPCRQCVDDGRRSAATQRATLEDQLPEQRTEWQPADTEFADARRVLDASPRREAALTSARMRLAAEGRDRPEFRELVLTAAAIITDQAEGTSR